MGQVALTLKVMPESPDVDMNQLKERIKQAADVKQLVENPVGFGLVMLEVLLVFYDKIGAGDFEGKISSIEGVGNVEAGDITLI